MKKLVTLLILGLAVPFSPASIAQTPKTHTHKDMQGKTIESPYITYSEFEEMCLDGQATIGQLFAVGSIDDVVQLLGEPEETSVVDMEGRVETVVSLNFDGLNLEYAQVLGELRLRSMEVTASSRFIQIGETKLSPGDSSTELSKEVYSEYEQASERFSRSSAGIKVTREGKKAGNFLDFELQIKINQKTESIDAIQFTRII